MSKRDNQKLRRDKKRLTLHIFQDVEGPNKDVEFSEIQKNLTDLKQDVNLLQACTVSKSTAEKVLKKMLNTDCDSNHSSKRIQNHLFSIASPKKIFNEKNKAITQNKKYTNRCSKKSYDENNYDNVFVTNLSANENYNANFSTCMDGNQNLKIKKSCNKEHINNLRQKILPPLQKYSYFTTTKNKINSSFDNYNKNKIKTDALKNLFMTNISNRSIILNNKSSFKNLKSLKLSRNRKKKSEDLPKITYSLVKKMQKNSGAISKKIKSKLLDCNLIKWDLDSRIKYLDWKFGILEIDKYFMDIDEFTKPQEMELEKRKSLAEQANDVISDIQKSQKEKSPNNLDIKYGIKAKLIQKKEEDLDEKKDIDIILEKKTDVYKNLQLINKRKKSEKNSRKKIDDLLYRCGRKVNLINLSTFERKKRMDNL